MTYNTPRATTRTAPKYGYMVEIESTHCEMPHCEGELSDEVGIRLCVQHLQKAWAAYELIKGSDIEQFRGKLPDMPGFWEKKGHVYFAQVGKFVKIGWSTNVKRRMGDLGADVLYYTEPGTRRDEAEYHKLFRKHLATGKEYFYPVPTVMNFIKELQTGVAA